MTNLDSIFKSRNITLPTKFDIVKTMVIPVVMYGCESWTMKKAEQQRIDAFELLEKTLKGIPSWILIAKTDAEVPILWPPDAKSQFIGKDSHAGKNCGQEEKRVTEDEMIGLHHWLNRHEFKQTQGVSDGQGCLVCCSPWGHKELDIRQTEQHNRVQASSAHCKISQWIWDEVLGSGTDFVSLLIEKMAG